MNEIRMCVVFCLQMKKKNHRFFCLAATLKKTRERTREEIFIIEISSVVLILLLLAFLINSLERTNEGTRNTIRALTEKEERGPHFRERAE